MIQETTVPWERYRTGNFNKKNYLNTSLTLLVLEIKSFTGLIEKSHFQ